MNKKRFASAAVSALLAACAGLPSRPPPPVLHEEVPIAGINTPGTGQWPDSQWWKRYNDPQLDGLIELALKGSPTLSAAQTRFDSAIQTVRAARAAAGVRADGSATWERQRLSDSGLIPPKFLGFNWYSQGDIGLHLSYTFDWWGKQHALIESVVDQMHAAEAESAAASLTLASAVTDTYFGWQSDQARLVLTQEVVQGAEKIRELDALRVGSGIDSPDLLSQADADVATAREQVVELEGSAQLRRVALAALAGVSVDALPALNARPLPQIDSKLPDNVRIDLIARRPDIVASRWRVESAARNVDEARAEFFPDISISALAGLSAIDMSKLLRASSAVYALTPALHLPIFDGGLIRARYGVSQAELDAAVASYNSTLIDAARELGTQALTAQQLDAQRKQRSVQIDSAQALLDSSIAREHQGLTDLRIVLNTGVALLQQRDALLQLDTQALSTNIALTKALGGGYTAPTATEPKN
jgi:multidrug efflux system outer membrane protein